jgi:hypothetical protein
MKKITLSNLPKTWVFDVDGTIVEHNGYLKDGDKLLNGVKDFFNNNIKDRDIVILLTSRKECYIKDLKIFLLQNNIRFNHLIYDLTFGERILFNDKKPSGLKTAFAINLNRDSMLKIEINIDDSL